MLEFVPERWKGEVASFDIKDRDGNVIVEKDKRVNAKHLRDLGAAKVTYVSVPEEFLIGRVLARNVISPETRSEEHTSELQSLMRISYAVFCLKQNKKQIHN